MMVGETKLCAKPCSAEGVHEGSPGQKLPFSSLHRQLHSQCGGGKENSFSKQRNLASLWLEMFGLSLKFPLFLLDLSPSEISFCKQVFSLPGCGSSAGDLLSA